MAKVNIPTISSGFASTTVLNSALDTIESELNNKVLYRNPPAGEPNQLEADIDANDNTIYNVRDAVDIDEVVTLGQMQRFIAASATGAISTHHEQQTAIEDQTVVTFTGLTYVQGINNLAVFVNGLRQRVSVNYTETSSTSITFTSSLNAGDVVDIYTNEAVTSTTLPANSISYTPAGTGAVSTDVQSKLRETVSVKDFGAVGDGVTDDTAAIQAANTYAVSVGKTLYFSKGNYKYAPSATLEISTNWHFEDVQNTRIMCQTASYSGEFFRVTGTNEIINGWIWAEGDTRLGVGLMLSNSDNSQFTGNIKLTRTRVRGFDKNIFINNVFLLTCEAVRSDYGNDGVYCVPYNDDGDNGYINDHLFLNCVIEFNQCNVYYAPPVQGQRLQFIGGSIQIPYGEVASINISTVRGVRFQEVHFEGGSAIPALLLNDCETTISGGYFNGTGGINLGTANNRLSANSVYTTSGTDILYCTTSGNIAYVNLVDCQFPASGNNITGIDYGVFINTTIDGTFHANTQFTGSSLSDVEMRLCPSAYPTNTTPRFVKIVARNGGAGNPTSVDIYTNASSANPMTTLSLESNGDIYGRQGVTNMIGGFLYAPSGAGAPSGTPTTRTGRVALYYDTTNNNFYVYNGAWKKVLFA